jgi:hypothetical protein
MLFFTVVIIYVIQSVLIKEGNTMKRIFFAMTILATSFSYGMEKKIQITDVPVFRRSLNESEDTKLLKKSPRKNDLVGPQKPLKQFPDIKRTLRLSEESPRFKAEENMFDLIQRRDSDKNNT